MKKELLEAYNYRYACKEFKTEKKISDEDFNYILETGRLSPSSYGWEPWKFLVVQNPDLREKMLDVCWGAQKALPTASHFVVFLSRRFNQMKSTSDYLKYIAKDVQHLPEEIQVMKANHFDQFMANDFEVTDDRTGFDWAAKQAYIPLANMLTTAATLSIDSCPIEGFNRKKVEELLVAEGLLDTNEFGVAVMASFGYRADNQEIFPKTRRELKEVVQFIK